MLSGSKHLRICAGLILVDFIGSNAITYFAGMQSAVNYIAPLNILLTAAFWQLSNLQKHKDSFFYRTFMWLYVGYIGINAWHLGSRVFFPDAFTATTWYVYAGQNAIFIAILATLGYFSSRKIYRWFASFDRPAFGRQEITPQKFEQRSGESLIDAYVRYYRDNAFPELAQLHKAKRDQTRTPNTSK